MICQVTLVHTVVLDRCVGDRHPISIKRLQDVMEEISVLDVHDLCDEQTL